MVENWQNRNETYESSQERKQMVDKRAVDILRVIRDRGSMATPEQRKTAVQQRARDYDVTEIVQQAALMGIDYAEDYGIEVAEGLIRCNRVSMTTRVLDALDTATKEEQDHEQI
jgi:hypothetical protein